MSTVTTNSMAISCQEAVPGIWSNIIGPTHISKVPVLDGATMLPQLIPYPKSLSVNIFPNSPKQSGHYYTTGQTECPADITAWGMSV
ncbi:hypothetical protein L198_03796 [Cryptococcus wingfieldii CBS 7118]|uniref:Uncharacterized protein n=1 Tax=Cryptococcus wingfieldii CBS 7118 TaxID=1295528 RepID=A0A1E3JCF0_9TREE|nr:hypothetical protein L198_03796 [Cryptococcus wingfieldii CBS 7118]ODN98550.1 hypothetical protein L198_03796 [Cryptococcus wingfieldii CBS 7118]